MNEPRQASTDDTLMDRALPGGAPRVMRRSWGWILAHGLLLIAIGAVAMFNPIPTNFAIGVLFGILLLIVGIASFVAGFRDFGWQSKLVDFLFGLFALIGAFVFIAMPVLSATSLVWAAGIFFIVNGLFELYHGFKTHDHRAMLLALGAIDLLLGIYLAFLMPIGSQILALAWFVGLAFIFRGVLLAIVAFRVRGMSGRIAEG
ncbi:HdeD family acid-resistance protein [Croceicoccus marinus]|uniref:DUF308 domain-containing protein n=1 Tax=Croceicoccus marinus TaxID=450378 RepID=A0A1Z1FGS8_9SPHN|nr:DUF308 domain-containing protein [Croceicoccus marinus]ARU18008.1 hypothetical protein A9D14_17015 [Croceicoccus marinus]QNE07513.1 DUF308 domain-containing protein [Croceicoccus marinus]